MSNEQDGTFGGPSEEDGPPNPSHAPEPEPEPQPVRPEVAPSPAAPTNPGAGAKGLGDVWVAGRVIKGRVTRRGWAVLVAAGLVVLVGIAALVVGSLGGDEEKTAGGAIGGEKGTKKKAVGEWGGLAGGRVGGVAGVRYIGRFDVGGRNVAARVSVARGGSGSGVLTAGKERAELVMVGGDAYVKAGRGFWAAYGGKATNASDFAGRWTRVPDKGLDFDLDVLAGPGPLGPRLKAGDAEKGTETVQGKAVRRISTPQGDYLIDAEAPYKVVSYVGRSGRFDLTELPDTAGLYDEIKGRVSTLGGAREAGVRFVPGKLAFGNCNDNIDGCKLDLPATKVTQGDGANQALAAMTATITAEGRTLGTCQDVRPVGTARKIVLSCTVRGKGWKSWMREARETPGAHPYEAKALVVAQAVTPADVTALLARLSRESQGG